MTLPCPECGGLMDVKPIKVREGSLPGFHFYCAGMKPRHQITIFWKRPADSPPFGEGSSGESSGEKKEAGTASSQVSSRAAALLARAEKLK